MNQKINRVSEQLFRQLLDAGEEYRTEVIAAVNEYKSKLEKVEETARQRYKVRNIVSSQGDLDLQRAADRQSKEEEQIISKYRDDYVQEKKAVLIESARTRIRKSQDDFQFTARTVAKSLRSQLEEALISPVSSAFTNYATMLLTFGVAPSELEVRALVNLADGNATAIRCLSSLLEKTGSQFHLSYKHPDDFASDLNVIEELGTDSTFCSPLTFHLEMCEIFRNQKISRDEESASFKRDEKFDSVSLLIYGQTFELHLQEVEQRMMPSWAADVHFESADSLSAQMEAEERYAAELLEREPGLSDYESSTQVQDSGEDGTALAVELGREAAAAKAPVSESLGDLVK